MSSVHGNTEFLKDDLESLKGPYWVANMVQPVLFAPALHFATELLLRLDRILRSKDLQRRPCRMLLAHILPCTLQPCSGVSTIQSPLQMLLGLFGATLALTLFALTVSRTPFHQYLQSQAGV